MNLWLKGTIRLNTDGLVVNVEISVAFRDSNNNNLYNLKYTNSLNKIYIIFSSIIIISCCDTNIFENRQTSQNSIIYNNEKLYYYVSTPDNFDSFKSYPLLVALHGGTRVDSSTAFWLLEQLYIPAFEKTDLIIVAPNSPSNFGWSKNEGIESIIAILKDINQNYLIDSGKYIVSGYSMGAIMAWYVVEQIPDQFIGAISVSGRYGWESIPYPVDDQINNPYSINEINNLLDKQFYVINSRIDDQFPFVHVEWQMEQLSALGVSVQFNIVDDLTHTPAAGFIPHLKMSIPWITSLINNY